MNNRPPAAQNCPDAQLLRAFNSGLVVDVAVEEQLTEHLSVCGTCESLIAAFDDTDDPIVRLLRQPAPRIDDEKSLEATKSLYKSQSESTEANAKVVRDKDDGIPVRIGDYFVIRELGSGSFAQVLLAKDPQHDRLVAIKVPHSSYTHSKHRRDQFLKEARTVAALSHPHLVPVYDCRELPDGRCIVVMKYIEGRTLRDFMRSERIDPRRAVELVATVADAMQIAHERGVWHRDIKPANILLDSDGRPYLSDFGLAIHEHQQPLLSEELAGTFPYMSPEQVRRETRHLDGRSDIWSLGVILYELLARQRPFRGGNVKALADEILNREPKPLRQYDRTIGTTLEDVCLKSLRKSPADRFATATEFADSLRKSVRVAIWRRPAVLVSSLLLLVLIVAGLFAFPTPRLDSPATVARTTELPLRAVAWPTIVGTDFYDRLDDSGRIAVKSSSSMCCLETHRPPSQHYEMHASAEFKSGSGFAGLALGIHETSAAPTKFRCLIVYVSSDFPEEGTWLKIQDCEIGMNELQHMDFRERRGVANVKLDDAPCSSFDLRVEIDHQRIVRVAYNDQPVNVVEVNRRNLNVPPNTTCGIMVLSHVVFHSLTCKEL